MGDYQRAPVLDADDRAEVPDYVIQELDRVWAANVNYWAAVAIYRRSAGKDELFNSSLEWGNVDRELFQRLFWRSPLLEQSSPELAALNYFMPSTEGLAVMDTRDLPQPMSLELMTEIAFAQEKARTARDMEKIQQLRRGQLTHKAAADQPDASDTKSDPEKKDGKKVRHLKAEHRDCIRIYKAARRRRQQITMESVIADYILDNPDRGLSASSMSRTLSDHGEEWKQNPTPIGHTS